MTCLPPNPNHTLHTLFTRKDSTIMTAQTLHPTHDISAAASRSVIRQLAAGALLGLVVFYGVAFADSPDAHNAAHDVRHVTVKPCH